MTVYILSFKSSDYRENSSKLSLKDILLEIDLICNDNDTDKSISLTFDRQKKKNQICAVLV